VVRRNNDRIPMSFNFPDIWQRVKTYCNSCNVCQMRARKRQTALVTVRPTDHHKDNFGHLETKIIRSMGDGQYKYAPALIIVQSRYVTAFELTASSGKNIVDKIILHSLPRYISFDFGTHFTTKLMKVCLERLGASP
jgi:hypothetical protein